MLGIETMHPCTGTPQPPPPNYPSSTHSFLRTKWASRLGSRLRTATYLLVASRAGPQGLSCGTCQRPLGRRLARSAPPPYYTRCNPYHAGCFPHYATDHRYCRKLCCVPFCPKQLDLGGFDDFVHESLRPPNHKFPFKLCHFPPTQDKVK